MKHFGKFKIEIRNEETGIIKDTGYIDNLVLNNYFSEPSSRYYFKRLYLCFGTGSTTPAVTDKTLVDMVPGVIGTNTSLNFPQVIKGYDSTTKIFTHTIEITFEGGKGDIQGNISELGLSYNSSVGNTGFITRALVKDEQGNPTTISLGENDILTVNYTIGYTVDLTSSLLETKTINIKGQDTTVSYHAIGYDSGKSSTSLGLWATESSISTANKYLAWCVNRDAFDYLKAYTGSVLDFSKATVSEETDVVYSRFSSLSSLTTLDGTSIKKGISEPIVVDAGTGTGTWNFLVLSYKRTSLLDNKFDSSIAMVFDPPIIKDENEEFIFNNLDLICSRKI